MALNCAAIVWRSPANFKECLPSSLRLAKCRQALVDASSDFVLDGGAKILSHLEHYERVLNHLQDTSAAFDNGERCFLGDLKPCHIVFDEEFQAAVNNATNGLSAKHNVNTSRGLGTDYIRELSSDSARLG